MSIIKPNLMSIIEGNEMNTWIGPVKTILVLAANPKFTPPLRLDEEVREIEEGLARSKCRDRFEFHAKWAVRLRDFRKALLDYEPNIVHFIGHGEEEGILVEDDLGNAVRFSGKALSELFKLCASHVGCVILNACFTAPQASAINKHIDYVIGMKKALKDKAAIEFSVGFYDALGAGRPIEDAFAFGRAAVLAVYPDLPEHLIPVLKTRGKSRINENLPFVTEGKKEMVKMKVCIETTGSTFDVNVPLDTGTVAFKNHLIGELKLPKTFEDGMPIPYYLLDKTRDRVLNDTKTLRENGVQDNDVLVFLVEVDDE